MRTELTCEAGGQRLDQWLASALPAYSRGHVQALIAEGRVLVDGRPVKPSAKLRPGALVLVDLPEALPDEDFEGWILHEDKDLIVLRKPAGLLMHPLGETWLRSPEAALVGQPNLAGILLGRRPKIAAAGVPRCGIVHRLDRPTSGLLLVAKTPGAARALTEDFKHKRIVKVYRAIVRGSVGRSANVEAPIGRQPGRRRVSVTPFGRAAQTGVRVVSARAQATLVEARPLTGRTHQIRAHLALLGHPVAGDQDHDRPDAEPRPPRLMLHAYRLKLLHPATGKALDFKTEPPADFKAFWRACR